MLKLCGIHTAAQKLECFQNEQALKGGIYLEGVVSTMIESVLMVGLAQLPNPRICQEFKA